MAAAAELLVCFVGLILCCTASDTASYTAAVYEHSAQSSSSVTDRESALELMYKNLEVYEQRAREAKDQGADIIVFPEYGISGLLPLPRNSTVPYLEIAVDQGRCLCDAVSPRAGQEVQHSLSCIAKRSSIYVVANMVTFEQCQKEVTTCPADGRFQYNTNVVYDRFGCLLATYHKQNLFVRELLIFDKPDPIQHIYFETEFGRFGVMTCFDAVFHSPAVGLVTEYNVTDIVFPTAWMNVLPHYVSVAYHSGWARTMGVNFLSSNIHNIGARMVGSGIYSSLGVLNYTFNRSSAEDSLVVARVPINNVPRAYLHERACQPAAQYYTALPNGFESLVFGDTFSFRALESLSGNLSVCQGTVCCHLEFERNSTSELFALGAFDGMHFLEGKYYLEICMLVYCEDNNRTSCGSSAETSTTAFGHFNLTSTMSTLYAFPEVLNVNYDFGQIWDLEDHGCIKSVVGKSQVPLISVVLMGRNFDKDKEMDGSTSKAELSAAQLGSFIVLLLILLGSKL